MRENMAKHKSLLLAQALVEGDSLVTSHPMASTILLLIVREWQRLFNEPSRLVGMLAQPLLFLAVFGAGFHQSFQLGRADIKYIDFFFPGILGLVVLFSSIYATLTLVDDKKCGFFRLVLLGPAGVYGAVLGKTIATASLGFLQSLLFLPFSLVVAPKTDLTAILWAVVFLLLGSWCFSLIGVLFAWLCPSASAFHAVMSVILIPMWLVSGAMFPVDDGIFFLLSIINPMAYLVAGLRSCLLEINDIIGVSCVGLLSFSLSAFLLLKLAIKKRPLE